MLQAAAEGAIDFRDADKVDRRVWWHKVRSVTGYLERREAATVRESVLAIHAGALDYAHPQALDHHLKQANQLYRKIEQLRMPWLQPLDAKSMAAAMRKDYVESFGDPNDPKFAAQVDALVAKWESEAKEGNAVSTPSPY